jgi:Alpha/beta hydrolase of unknown function (DUF900)
MLPIANVRFLSAFNADLDQITALLGGEWQPFQEMLLSILRRIEESESESGLAAGVDDIVDLLLETPAGPPIRDMLRSSAEPGKKDPVYRRDPGYPYRVPSDSAELGSARALAGSASARLVMGAADSCVIIPVLYATDREPAEKGVYSGKRGKLEYGLAEVSIPSDGRLGSMPRPRWWKLQFHEDPKRHVVLRNAEVRSQEEFVKQMREMLAEEPDSGALIYIHGYNVPFVDSVRRTAQLAYDLNYKGVPLLYSWPSLGRTWLYTFDETNVAWTQPHLQNVL